MRVFFIAVPIVWGVLWYALPEPTQEQPNPLPVLFEQLPTPSTRFTVLPIDRINFPLPTKEAAWLQRVSVKIWQRTRRRPGRGVSWFCEAVGASADRSRVVGLCGVQAGLTTKEVFRSESFLWTPADETLTFLGRYVGKNNRPVAMSADGSTVIGYHGDLDRYRSSDVNNVTPLIWTEEDGLRHLPGIPSGIATGVSADGSVIVGQRFSDTWFADTFFEKCQPIVLSQCVSRGNFSRPQFREVSSNKKFLLSSSDAFVWTKTKGTRFIRDILQQEIPDQAQGLTFRRAESISPDGRIITVAGHAGEFTAHDMVRVAYVKNSEERNRLPPYPPHLLQEVEWQVWKVDFTDRDLL